MPFQNGDRARLVDALQLVATQDNAVGVLATLMTNLERRDTANNTDRAGQIRVYLRRIESADDDLLSLDTAVLQAAQDGPITEKTVNDQYSVQYGGGGSGTGGQTTEALQLERLNTMRNRIRRWLDPYGYLARYIGVGRAIDG